MKFQNHSVFLHKELSICQKQKEDVKWPGSKVRAPKSELQDPVEIFKPLKGLMLEHDRIRVRVCNWVQTFLAVGIASWNKTLERALNVAIAIGILHNVLHNIDSWQDWGITLVHNAWREPEAVAVFCIQSATKLSSIPLRTSER